MIGATGASRHRQGASPEDLKRLDGMMHQDVLSSATWMSLPVATAPQKDASTPRDRLPRRLVLDVKEPRPAAPSNACQDGPCRPVSVRLKSTNSGVGW